MPVFFRNLLLGLAFFVSIPAIAQPVINVTPNPATLSGCAPLTVQFNNSTNATSHSWTFPGAAPPSINQSPSVSFITPGTYTVTYLATNGTGSSTKTFTITVHASPVVDFTATPTSGCADLPVQLTDASTPGGNVNAATYSWVAGPYVGGTKNPNVTFAPCGTYNVSLKVTNSFGCQSTITKTNYVNVFCKPNVSFAATPTVHCLTTGGPTQFNSSFTSVVSGGTSPYSYLWDFGNSPPFGNTANPTNTYTSSVPTSYPVKLTVTDANGCKAELVKPAYIEIQKVTASFNAPLSACVFAPVTVTNTSTPGITYTSWNWGDMSGNTLGSPATHYYANPGTYTITLTTQNGACTETTTKTITILPQPNINFYFAPPKPCPAPQLLSFTGTGASSYTWDFGTAPGGTGANPTHTYTNNGFYTVTMIGQNSNGCKDTVTYADTVKIYDGTLEITADTPGGCIPKKVCFSSFLFTTIPAGKYLYPHAKQSYFWEFGDGNTSTQAAPCHTYTTLGIFVVKLKITTVNGCIFEDTAWIKTGPKPIASFTAAPTHICTDRTVYFTNTSINSTEWFWDFGSPPPSTTKDASHLYDMFGTYTVTLHASNNFCKDTFQVIDMIVVDPPKALGTAIPSCDTPLKVNFQHKSLRYTWFKWYFGDPANTTSTLQNPSFIYPSLGSYNAYLVAFNDTFGCYDTLLLPLTLMSPTVTMVASDTSICPTQSITFTAGVLNGVAKEYYWYVNNAYQDFNPVYTHTFNTPGIYTIKLVIRDGNDCLRELVKTNWVIVSKPNVNFSASPSSGCMPLQVGFTDLSTPLGASSLVSRFWDFGPWGTLTTTGTTASILYTAAGSFDVKLVLTDDNGCKDSLTKFSYVKAYKPTADFNVSDPDACLNQDITFFNASLNAVSAAWSFGDNGTASVLQPTHAYTQPGTYDVRMVVTDAQGCKDTMLKPAYIGITKPEAIFGMDDSFAICEPHIVKFTDSSKPASQPSTLTWEWHFGNTSSVNVTQNPSAVYKAGLYTPMLIVTDPAGCTDTAIHTVNVLGYSGAINYTPLLGCVPLTVTFNVNVTNVPSIIWDFNDGNTFSTTSSAPVTHTYVTPGAYVPKIIFSDGGSCSSGSVGIDTIKADGVFPGFIHSPICEGYTVQFEDTSKGMFSPVMNWAWTFDDGKTSTSKKPTHYYPKIGTYPISLIITNGNGCKDTISQNITVNPLPVISAGGDTIICLKDYALLSGTGGVSYVWTPAGTLDCTNCQQPKASPQKLTEYTVIGTDANGCSDTDKVIVDIKIKTTSNVDEGGEICDDEAMMLRAYDAHRYEWSPASDLDDPKSPNPLARPHHTTTFMVVAYEGSCIPDTNFVKVIVHPKPTVRASGETTIIAGKSTPIDASGDLIKRFLWSPATSLTCEDCPSPMANPTKTTTYNITAFTEFNCADSAKVTIHVICDNSQLFIPNTFTPNGDGQNDIFYPRGVGLDQLQAFRIYNRWGEVVYNRSNVKLNDKSNGWDGTFKGNQLSPDVFVYIVEALCDNGEVLKLKGDITLVR